MDFKYRTSFAGKIKALTAEEGKVATASLADLSKYLPKGIDFSVNGDLLGISFNAAVVNKVNLNDDGIQSEAAVEIAKYFVHKFLNNEHQRNRGAKGFITNYAFSRFGTNELLTEEEARATKDPFYITLSGVIWKLIDSDLAWYIEECSDPNSPEYMSTSASWEIGFSENNILLLPKGKVNYVDGIILTSSNSDYEAASKCLRANGGSGVWQDFRVCRDIVLPALPLGIGITANPAGQVKGIQIVKENDEPMVAATLGEVKIEVEKEEEEDKEDDKEEKKDDEEESKDEHSEDCDCAKCKEKKDTEKEESDSKCDEVKADLTKEEKIAEINTILVSGLSDDKQSSISHILSDLKEFEKSLATVTKLTVIDNENLSTDTNMLTSFADINEEFLKTAQANELREFLEKQVAESASKASEQLRNEKAAVESEKAALANELETIKKQLADKESQLSALVAEKSLASAQELFNKRMSYFDEKFELATEDKQIIAKVLKDVKDDEAFAAYQKDMDVLLKGKVKGAKEAVASVVVVNEDKIVKAALDNADPEKVTVTAGAVKDEPKTLLEKYAKHFALNAENFKNR